VANGYLEIRDIASTFFCSNELDIWRLIAEKEIMDVSSLYTWYKGQNLEPILEKVTGIPCQNEKDDDKAEEFLSFLLDEKTNATESVRKKANVLKHL
jgi:trans-aconitate methyltransferase